MNDEREKLQEAENIVDFDPVYKNKSRRWLSITCFVIGLALWVWVLI